MDSNDSHTILAREGWLLVDEHEPPEGVRVDFTDGTGYIITSYPHKKLWENKGFYWWKPTTQK